MVEWGLRMTSDLKIETDEFQLVLGPGWIQDRDCDPDQFKFWSEDKGSSVVISYVRAQIPREKWEAGAQVLLDARMEAHREWEAQGGGPATFGDVWVTEVEGGQALHVAYAGYNDRDIFRFMGWVTEAKFLNFFVSTETRDNDYSQLVFDEVFSGFRFYIP